MFGDIRQPRWLYVKGALLLGTGLLASTLLLLDHPTWRTAVLLAIMIWAFCRAYYFAFYVIQHYVNPEFRFAGLLSFFRHAVSHRSKEPPRSDA
jgi:hypothetical protein